MKDTDKVTLTISQLKKLVTEAKKQKVNERDLTTDEQAELDHHKQWKKADRQLNPIKREIAQKGKTLYKQMCEKFINTMSKDFIKNNISFHCDRPQDAAREFLRSLMDDETMTVLVHEMYLFSND